ncbi:MAG: V-type ATPase subunit subunit G family protein [bacterium]
MPLLLHDNLTPGDAMTAKHGPSDENPLQVIAHKEKELEATLAQTREEARRLVEDARRRAERLREESRREADALAERARAEMAAEAERISKERLIRAQDDVAEVRSGTAEWAPEAVKLVIERVLGDLSER